MVGTNLCRIGVASDDRGIVVVTAALDNLLKGAAGQAVENMNLDARAAAHDRARRTSRGTHEAAAADFAFAGIACGIKPHRPDLALVVSDADAACAGAFTVNRAKAAPVVDAERAAPRRAACARS